MKRTALIAIFILLALTLCACGNTYLTAADPAPTPVLSTKLLASIRTESETIAAGALPQLIEDEHPVYLTPTAAGYIEPDEPLTRGDAALAFYTLLANPVSGACSFSDVSEGDALYDALCCLASWGIVSDSAGAFDPDGMLSRAQLMTMLSRFYPPVPQDVTEPYTGSFRRRDGEVERLPKDTLPPFEDTEDHWASAAIQNAVDRGWIEPGGKFYPDAAVTRAQFCRVMNRVLGRQGDEIMALLNSQASTFDDLPSDHEYLADVLEASCEHSYDYSDDNIEIWSGSTLEPGFYRLGGHLYCVQEDGSVLRNGSVGLLDFDEHGRYTTGYAELDDRLRGILLELGTDDMDPDEALRAVYLYCTHDHDYIYHNWYSYGFDDVHEEFIFRALRFFDYGGVCYDFASAFGYLARSLGYNAYIIKGEVNQYYADHGFVVIPEDGVNYIYDAQLEATRPWLHADFGLFHITNWVIYDYWYDPWW